MLRSRSRSRSRPKGWHLCNTGLKRDILYHGQFTLLYLLFIPYWFTVYNGILCTLHLYTKHKYPVQYQYTLGKNWLHYCYYLLTLHNISLLQLLSLTAALPQYCVTAGGCLSVCEVVYPSQRLSGCREGKEEREGKGKGGCISRRKLGTCPSLQCTQHTVHCINLVYSG